MTIKLIEIIIFILKKNRNSRKQYHKTENHKTENGVNRYRNFWSHIHQAHHPARSRGNKWSEERVHAQRLPFPDVSPLFLLLKPKQLTLGLQASLGHCSATGTFLLPIQRKAWIHRKSWQDKRANLAFHCFSVCHTSCYANPNLPPQLIPIE